MKIRFIHDAGNWPHRANGANPSYLDVEAEQVPDVGDTVLLPDDFYGPACEVVSRQWFYGERQADVMITLNS